MKLQLLGKLFISIGLFASFFTTASDFSLEQEAVKQKLIDPESANFQKLIGGVNSKGEDAVCGEVNSRNRMGGYGGFKRFVVLEHSFVVFEGDSVLGKVYKLSGCAGPEVELITRLGDEASFSCSVLWTMTTNAIIEGETPSSAVDSALRATINRAQENGVTLLDVQIENIEAEFLKALNGTLANKGQVKAITKSPDYQRIIFEKTCTAQTLQILKVQVGIK